MTPSAIDCSFSWVMIFVAILVDYCCTKRLELPSPYPSGILVSSVHPALRSVSICFWSISSLHMGFSAYCFKYGSNIGSSSCFDWDQLLLFNGRANALILAILLYSPASRIFGRIEFACMITNVWAKYLRRSFDSGFPSDSVEENTALYSRVAKSMSDPIHLSKQRDLFCRYSQRDSTVNIHSRNPPNFTTSRMELSSIIEFVKECLHCRLNRGSSRAVTRFWFGD